MICKNKHNDKSLVYVAIYNKNNPELLTGVIENLEHENADKIKEIQSVTNGFKSQRQPKNILKNTHLTYIWDMTKHKVLLNARIKYVEFVI